VEGGDGGTVVKDLAVGSGVLEDGAEYFNGMEISRSVAEDDGPAQGLGTGLDDGDGLGVAVAIDEEGGAGGFGGALGERHGLGGGGGFVEQRGVGDVEAGEIADHGLEVDEGF